MLRDRWVLFILNSSCLILRVFVLRAFAIALA